MHLRFKWVIYITLIIIVVSLILTFFFIRQVQISERDAVVRYAISIASNLAYNSEYGVLISNKDILSGLTHGVVRESDVAYCVIEDKDGNVILYDGNVPETKKVSYVNTILDSDKAMARFYNTTHGVRICEAIAPIFTTISEGPGSEFDFFTTQVQESRTVRIGSVRVGVSMSSADARLSKLQRLAVFVTLVVVLVGILVTWLLVGAIVTPIHKLVEGTRRISEGDLEYRVDILTRDELGRLGSAFNKMTDELKISRGRLEENIAQLKKTEKELRVANDMLQDILEKAPFGVYVVNNNGYIDYVNPAMVHISGTTYEEFKGLNIFELPTYREIGLSDKIRKALNGTPFYIGPVEYRSHLGGKVTIRNFTGIPLLESEDKRVLVFVEDVTELKKTQFQLIQAEKMETIGRLASGIAHEVKNPLAIILQCVEYLVKNISTDDKNISMTLEYIKEAVKRADNVVRGLLDFSGTSRLDLEMRNINIIAERALFLLKHQFDRYHIRVIKELQEDLPLVEIDENRIEQVFVNIFLNAISAMPQGGEILIKSFYEPGDKTVVFKIEDTGVGIPEDILDKIFEPFFTTRRTSGGTGLGLSVVKNIIDLHNGKIFIQNRKDSGVEVVLIFNAKARG